MLNITVRCVDQYRDNIDNLFSAESQKDLYILQKKPPFLLNEINDLNKEKQQLITNLTEYNKNFPQFISYNLYLLQTPMTCQYFYQNNSLNNVDQENQYMKKYEVLSLLKYSALFEIKMHIKQLINIFCGFEILKQKYQKIKEEEYRIKELAERYPALEQNNFAISHEFIAFPENIQIEIKAFYQLIQKTINKIKKDEQQKEIPKIQDLFSLKLDTEIQSQKEDFFPFQLTDEHKSLLEEYNLKEKFTKLDQQQQLELSPQSQKKLTPDERAALQNKKDELKAHWVEEKKRRKKEWQNGGKTSKNQHEPPITKKLNKI